MSLRKHCLDQVRTVWLSAQTTPSAPTPTASSRVEVRMRSGMGTRHADMRCGTSIIIKQLPCGGCHGFHVVCPYRYTSGLMRGAEVNDNGLDRKKSDA